MNRLGEVLDTNGGRLWRNGKWSALADLLPPDLKAAGWQVTAGDINDSGLIVAGLRASGAQAGSDFSQVGLLAPATLVPDWNRDGAIDARDYGQATEDRPFRWWVNDDADHNASEVAESWEDDFPGAGTGDGGIVGGPDTTVSGMRDLVDFFPLRLDIARLLEIFDPSTHTYRCKTDDAGPSALAWVKTDLAAAQAGRFLSAVTPSEPEKLDAASTLASGHSGAIFVPAGSVLPTAWLVRLRDNPELGVLLFEGLPEALAGLAQDATRKVRLRLEVCKTDGSVVATTSLPVELCRVEQMYRHLNLRQYFGQGPDVAYEQSKEASHPPCGTEFMPGCNPAEPPGLPDDCTNGDWLVMLHGYNNNGEQARASLAEMFKRFYQAGSRARFIGVSWHGDESQAINLQIPGIGNLQQACPKFYENVENAMLVAPPLAAAINALPPGRRVFASHSLGGLVLGEAVSHHGMRADKLLMFNPAFGVESLLPKVAQGEVTLRHAQQDADMQNPAWAGYPEEMKASEWHDFCIFPAADKRGELTWRGRIAAAGPITTVFYSSGEEVLTRQPLADIPSSFSVLVSRRHAWPVNEKLKGLVEEDAVLNLPPPVFSAASPCGGWAVRVGSLKDAYEFLFPALAETVAWDPDADGTTNGWRNILFPQAHYASLLAQDRSGFRTRMRQDPVWGASPFGFSHTPPNREPALLPPGCDGLFDDTHGAAVAADPAKFARILAWMIPNRTLPAGGAGGGGDGAARPLERKARDAGSRIDTVDMNASQNGWPQERLEDDQKGDKWLHGDIREVALPFTWNVMKLAVGAGKLEQTRETP